MAESNSMDETDPSPPTEEQLWEDGWEGHRQAQMQRLARLPLWEKLAWLEEAQEIANHLQAQRAGQAAQHRGAEESAPSMSPPMSPQQSKVE